MSEVDQMGVAKVMEETCDYMSARWAEAVLCQPDEDACKVIMLLRQTAEKFHFTSRYCGPISCFGSSYIMHFIQLMFNKWLKQ